VLSLADDVKPSLVAGVLSREEEVGWADVLAVPVLAELARTKYAALFGLTCMARTAACMTDLGGSGSRLIEPVGEFVEPP
jgi:hypothetical protein